MPKVRDRTRIGQEFAVLPWQQRHDEKEIPEDALYSVQSVNLFAPSGTQFPREAVLADAKPSDEDLTEDPDDESDSGGWIIKDTSAETTPTRRRAATHAAAEARPIGAPASVLTMVLHEPAATLQYAPGSGGDSDLASGSDAETQPPEQEEEDGVEADAADSHEPLRPPELLGVCQLAITPSGRGMGHIVITASGGVAGGAHACAGAARPAVLVLGVATQPVAATEELDPCFADESFDLLRLRLTHMQPGARQAAADLKEAGPGPGSAAAAVAAPAAKRGCSSSGNGNGSSGGRSSSSRGRGRSVEVLVSRTGGDMARLTAPPEEWLVRRTLGDHALALMRQRQRQRGEQPGMGGEETGLQEEQKDGQEEGHRRHQAGADGYCYSSDSEGEPLLDPRLDPFIAQGLGLASGTRAASRRRRRQPAGGAGGGAVGGGGGAKSPRRRGRWAANAEAKAEAGDADDGAPGMAPAGEGSGRRAARVKRQRTGAGRPVPREEGQSEEGQQGEEEEEGWQGEEEEGRQGEEEARATASEEDGTEAGDDADDDSDDGDDIEPEADIQLSFQPETLLSGGAALARMADFARPLLPRRLRLAAATAAAAAGPAGVEVKMEGEAGAGARAGAGAGAGDKGAEARGGAGGVPGAAGGQDGDGNWAKEDEEWEEAVVCVGPVRVRGLPRSWRRRL